MAIEDMAVNVRIGPLASHAFSPYPWDEVTKQEAMGSAELAKLLFEDCDIILVNKNNTKWYDFYDMPNENIVLALLEIVTSKQHLLNAQ